MTKMTPEEFYAKLDRLGLGCHEAIADGMEKAALNIESVAKKYCTPGHSPYDWFQFPTKQEQAANENREYFGAPYSLQTAVLHMRDTIQGSVRDEGDYVVGVVWTPVQYAAYVHEGTSRMMGRPFLLDAAIDSLPKTMNILAASLRKAIREECE